MGEPKCYQLKWQTQGEATKRHVFGAAQSRVHWNLQAGLKEVNEGNVFTLTQLPPEEFAVIKCT